MLTLPENTIDIYVDSTSPDSIKFHDNDNQCMKTIIDSFNMGDIFITKYHPGFYGHGLQAVFHLKNLDSIKIKLMSKSEVDFSISDLSKEYVLTKCAIKSILRHLYTQKCLQQDAVTFQTRQGNHLQGNLEVSPLSILILNPTKSEKDSISITFSQDKISRTYAYLEEKRLCIFFNKLTQEQEENIKSVLSELFRERDCAYIEDKAEQKTLTFSNS